LLNDALDNIVLKLFPKLLQVLVGNSQEVTYRCILYSAPATNRLANNTACLTIL
jgi:hypothetical protein